MEKILTTRKIVPKDVITPSTLVTDPLIPYAVKTSIVPNMVKPSWETISFNIVSNPSRKKFFIKKHVLNFFIYCISFLLTLQVYLENNRKIKVVIEFQSIICYN